MRALRADNRCSEERNRKDGRDAPELAGQFSRLRCIRERYRLYRRSIFTRVFFLRKTARRMTVYAARKIQVRALYLNGRPLLFLRRNCELTAKYLSKGGALTTQQTFAPRYAVELSATGPIHAPDVTKVLASARALPGYEHVPIVMVTVHDDRKVRYAALDAGITDFLTKPVDARECLARCRNLLTLRRQALALEDRRRLLEHMVEDATKEVREREKETLLRLARAGEFRDEETGYHLIRMSRYSRLIAGALGLEHDEAETIELSAPLHDIGKIGIPDHILLKQGKLDDAEWQVMRRHPVIGHEILKGSASKYVRMGALIALGHHEKYEGSGYPNGLVGDHIPLCARIVAVADVYDALTSVRPYQTAWPEQRAFEYLTAQAARHFEPRMAAAFLGLKSEVAQIQREWQDPPTER